MRPSASARSRRALDSQADVETQLYQRPAQAPSGVQRIVPLVPQRIIEVKPQPRRRPARALGLNVFLMPRTAADPAPPWSATVAAIRGNTTKARVVRKRSRRVWVIGLLSFAIAFVAFASPTTRRTAIARARPVAQRAWSATRQAAAATATFTAREWRALRSARP